MTTPSYTSTSTRGAPSNGGVFIAPLAGLIDLFIDAEFEATADITEDPVESRATLTDHYQRKPRRIRLTAGTSDVEAGAGQRPVNAYKTIMGMMEDATVFSVATPYGLFRNMVIQSVTHKMDASTGTALVAALTVQEVFFRPVERTTADNAAEAQAGLARDEAVLTLAFYGRAIPSRTTPLATAQPVALPAQDAIRYETAQRLASANLGRVAVRELNEPEFNAAITRLVGTGLVARRDDNPATAQSR